MVCRCLCSRYRNIERPIILVVFLMTNNVYSDIGLWNMRMLKQQIKFILVYGSSIQPAMELMTGQNSFIKYNCPVRKCYVTNDVTFFGESLRQFDAIIFNGRALENYSYPLQRYSHQKYVYINMESSVNSPICDEFYDGFFNWTATYKLNSDIPLPYFTILNATGHPVGPQQNMHWITDMKDVDENFAKTLLTKRRAVAWFVSNCKIRIRNQFVIKLNKQLMKHKLRVDMYGKCGRMKCPKSELCDIMLRRAYYFYLALENSFVEDYVTEKVLHALQNNVVPIVLGGANYSRFLPPGSYINGGKLNVVDLADLIHLLIKTPKLYSQYFKWKNHYSFESTMPGDIHYHRAKVYYSHGQDMVCKLCKALHEEKKVNRENISETIRSWWNPDYVNDCMISQIQNLYFLIKGKNVTF